MYKNYLKLENEFLKDYTKLNKKENKTRRDYQDLFKKYYNCKLPYYIDSLFKEVFKIKNYTAKVLSYFIDLDYEYIKDNMITYDNELNIVSLFQRRSIGDKVIVIDDYVILLECNREQSTELINKNIHTFNGISYAMVERGKKIGNKTFIMISFDNYDRYKLDKDIYECYIKEEIKGIKERKNYKIYHVNLDKLRNVLYNSNSIAKLDEKTRILGYIVNTNKELYKKIEEDKEMDEVSQIIKEANEIMETKTLNLGDIINRSYAAYTLDVYESGEKKGRESGIIIGREEGLIEGRNFGLIEGHNAGLIEGRNSGLIEGHKNGIDEANTNTAIEMLKRKIDNKTISECTRLSMEKIIQLEKQLDAK